jgi:hypothetical protein
VKIYIGPYRYHYSTRKLEELWYQWRHKKKWYDVEEENYTSLDRAFNKFTDVLQDSLNCTINRFSMNRKINIRIDKYDTWGMDHTLSLIILPMLKQLRDTKHGSPLVDDEDVPESATPMENEWDTDEYHFKRWSWVLDEMIWTFEQLIDEDSDSQFYSGEHDIYWEKIENGNSEMKKGPNDTFTIDREGLDAHNKRISNGLILFGKYYRGLWD